MINFEVLRSILILILFANYLLNLLLELLNINYSKKPLPTDLKDLYNKEEYKKQQSYERENSVLSLIHSGISTIILILLINYGIFGKLYAFVSSFTDNKLLVTLLFFGIIGAGAEVISLPFTIYSTFVIEEKYGFNRMTPRLFVIDKIKSWLLAIVIGGSILAAITWFYQVAGKNFWVYAWIFVSAISIFIATFYTSLLLPLFNKLTPLPDGELRQAIEEFAKKAGFQIENIYTMDGSKRSTKANAFFSGLGPQKKVILYDTLIEQLDKDEIVAVLAHEIGHYRKKHITKGLAISVLEIGFLLWLFSLMVNSPLLSKALGYEGISFALGLFAFSILYSPISLIINLFTGAISRKFEFEADSFAKQYGLAEKLISALKKLARNHLSNLNPHPIYVMFHYSHPPLRERVERLNIKEI